MDWPFRLVSSVGRHLFAYLIAILAVGLAVGLRWAAQPILGPATLYLTLYPTLMIVGVFLGLGPTVVSGAVGVLALDWWVLAPVGSVDWTLAGGLRMLSVLTTAILVGWGGRRLREARREATRSAQAYRALYSHLQTVVDSSTDAIIGFDLSGRISVCNAAACRLAGLEVGGGVPEELARVLERAEFRDLNGRVVAPADRPPARALRGEAIEACELTVTPDGARSCFVASFSASPVRDGEGAVAGAVCVLRDVTAQKRADAELRSVALFPEQNPNPVLRLDQAGKLLYANRPARQMLELAGDSGSVLPLLLEAARQTLVDGSSRDFELPCGPDRVFWLGVVPFSELAYVNVYGRDITIRKRVEEALRRSEDQLRLITDAVPALISYIDTGFVYRLANRTYERWFGHDPEQIKGKHVAEVLGPAAWERVRPYMQQALTGEHVTYEEQLPYSRGSRWVHVTYAPDRGPDGVVRGFAVLVNDISDAKRSEQALRASEHFARKIIESSLNGAYIYDLQKGRNTYINPMYTRITGYTRQDLDALSPEEFFALFHPDDRGAIAEHMQQLRSARDGETFEIEYRFRHADGRWIWCLSRDAVFDRDDAGEPKQFIGGFVDITQRRDAEEARLQLLEAERAARHEIERVNHTKDEFLATVSHELRSPLSAILGWTRLLGRGKAPDTGKAIAIIERSATSLARIVDDLLDMSRIISGKARLSFQDVDVGKLVRVAADGFRIVAESKGLEMHEEISPHLIPIRCDPDRIQQVVSNLLSNAIKFTPQGGRILLRLTRCGDQLELQVSDTGQGISPEFLPKLFDKFLQADASTARTHGGLGLGLAIVRYFVEAHGGQVQASSDGEGRGATFTVRLPIAAAGTAIPGRDESEEEGEGLPGHVRVLLIDDDENTAQMVSRVLVETGARVITARSAREGLYRLSTEHPDIVVSDISMPGEDGYDLVRQIRASSGRLAGVACIALTALARPEDRQRALDLGFDEHLSKLSDPRDLVRTVSRTWRRVQARRADVIGEPAGEVS